MSYLVLPTLNLARAVSQELHYISRPASIRNQADVTSYALEVLPGPEPLAALAYNPTLGVPVHPQANTQALGDLMAPFFETEQERETLRSLIQSSERLQLKDITPLHVLEQLKSIEELETLGWLLN